MDSQTISTPGFHEAQKGVGVRPPTSRDTHKYYHYTHFFLLCVGQGLIYTCPMTFYIQYNHNGKAAGAQKKPHISAECILGSSSCYRGTLRVLPRDCTQGQQIKSNINFKGIHGDTQCVLDSELTVQRELFVQILFSKQDAYLIFFWGNYHGFLENKKKILKMIKDSSSTAFSNKTIHSLVNKM